MSTLSKEEWAFVESQLKSFFCQVKLRCDDHEVSLGLTPTSQYKNAIKVYVNGVFKGKWMMVDDDDEEGRRFFPVRKKSFYSQKQQRRAIRALGKKEAERMGFMKKHEYRCPFWTSFRSLKRHLIANNESIELLSSD